MTFTSFAYAAFLATVLTVYWLAPTRTIQNALLLLASYFFAGFVHPWFALLLAADTALNHAAAQLMTRLPGRRRLVLICCVAGNLALLGFFKYFNFFATNVQELAAALGFDLPPITLSTMLPLGISYYVFRGLSYSLDVHAGRIEPRESFLDVATFMAFFPLLVAGPIDRATRVLPQLEAPRRWEARHLAVALPLLASGLLKKLVVADSVAVYANKIFMLNHPPALLLGAGAAAFTLQIYADFSGYTDLARGSARLLGFDIMENFKSPYLALTPSDFWRRWHISFSTWIRDYLYIPLGGSRVKSEARYFLVLAATMGLSGLWHGAAWTYVAWGLYHGVLLFAYHRLGLGGRSLPSTKTGRLLAWVVMLLFTMVGWTIFRSPSLSWLLNVFTNFSLGLDSDNLTATAVALGTVAVYCLPLFGLAGLHRLAPKQGVAYTVAVALMITVTFLLAGDGGQDFIYFQF